MNEKNTTHECDAAADSAHVNWGSAAHGGFSAYAENSDHLGGLCAFYWRLLLSPVIAMGDAAWGSGAAFAQGVIKNIEVVGNRRVEPETVRSYLQFSAGDAYSAAKVDASIKALFATGLFADVSIDFKGSTVVVTVKENPVINQVAFEGNSEVDTATLTGEVQLKPRSVFTRAKAQADVQRILDVYRRQGRFAASVEPKSFSSSRTA